MNTIDNLILIASLLNVLIGVLVIYMFINIQYKQRVLSAAIAQIKRRRR